MGLGKRKMIVQADIDSIVSSANNWGDGYDNSYRIEKDLMKPVLFLLNKVKNKEKKPQKN